VSEGCRAIALLGEGGLIARSLRLGKPGFEYILIQQTKEKRHHG
jgi:hypothetical protein